MKPKILVLIPHFLPGTRYGGPTRSISNLVERLGDTFDFYILCNNHDFGSIESYPLEQNKWISVAENYNVQYADSVTLSYSSVLAIIRELNPDLIYLNSFFHPRFTVLPLILKRFGLLKPYPVLLATRGEMAPGALSIKATKKKLFLFLARLIGIYDCVHFHASSKYEQDDINKIISTKHNIGIAPNLGLIPASIPDRSHIKKSGILKILFISRISKMKNLEFLLKCLLNSNLEIVLSIYGPLENEVYWQECTQLIKKLPGSIKTTYHGECQYTDIPIVFSNHDILFLPTRGENFGQIILEALANGLPVLISDRTPWKNLEQQNAGFDIPLSSIEKFSEKLELFCEMDEKKWKKWSNGARNLAERHFCNPKDVEANKMLLLSAIGESKL
jgi:glycosyltransferase involved in cell wall biosynthesis